MNVLVAISQVRFRNCVLTTGSGVLSGATVFTSLGAGVGSVFD